MKVELYPLIKCREKRHRRIKTYDIQYICIYESEDEDDGEEWCESEAGG